MDGLPEEKKRRFINNFLLEMKQLVYEGRCFISKNIKNREGLIALGLTERQREEEILALSADNYFRGPSKDKLNNPCTDCSTGEKFSNPMP